VSQYTLHHGDCLDVLPTLEAQSADAVICDPPYGTTACKWDAVIPFAPMWAEIKRVLKPRGACVLFGSQPFTSALVMSNPGWFKYTWVWNKNNSAGFATAEHRPFIITEDVCVFGAGAVKYNPQMTLGVYRVKGFGGSASDCYGLAPQKGEANDQYYPKNIINITKINNREDLHPTQKPLALLEYLVKTYTDKGDLVLDFTMGSGTTGHACMNLGRRFVGIERDAGYFAIARERIMDAADPLRHMEAA
jgi:DNA modification methylase